VQLLIRSRNSGGWTIRSLGDALAMCHRLCGLSTYGLKAHIREMSTLPKLTIGHDTPLPLLFMCKVDNTMHTGDFYLKKYSDSWCPVLLPHIVLEGILERVAHIMRGH